MIPNILEIRSQNDGEIQDINEIYLFIRLRHQSCPEILQTQNLMIDLITEFDHIDFTYNIFHSIMFLTSKPTPKAPTPTKVQPPAPNPISRSESSGSHSPPSQNLKQLSQQNTRLKKYEQIATKSLTIIQNGVQILNKSLANHASHGSSSKQPKQGITLQDRIHQLRKQFELILKRAEGCQQIIKFVAETVSEGMFSPEFTKIRPSVSFRKLGEEVKGVSETVFSLEVFKESLKEENEQLRKELKNYKKKSNNGSPISGSKSSELLENQSVEIETSRIPLLEAQNKQITQQLMELRQKLLESTKERQKLLTTVKESRVEATTEIKDPGSPQMNTPKKPIKIDYNKHSKSQTKHTKICMPGIKGHFIALDNSSEENQSADKQQHSRIKEKNGDPKSFHSSESASKSQIQSYIEQVQKLKKQLEERQRNYELLQSRYKGLEESKVQSQKYVMDTNWGNDIEVEVVEIDLPLNGGDVCTKRRYLRKTIRRRSLSIARSIESKRFGVKANDKPSLTLKSPIETSPDPKKSQQNHNKGKNVFDVVRISQKSIQGQQSRCISSDCPNNDTQKNFEKRKSKEDLTQENRPNFFNRSSRRNDS